MKKTFLILTMLLALVMPIMADNNPVDIRAYESGGENRDQLEIPFSVFINGHSLSVSVNENVGLTRILITNENGVYIDFVNIRETPDDIVIIIDHEGFYSITLILMDGSYYFGGFNVRD
jgi:hypothetical protein